MPNALGIYYTQTPKPRHLIETRRLLEHWPRGPCIHYCHLFQCSLLMLILLFMLILSLYIYLVS